MLPRRDTGLIRHTSSVYGKSREGNPITVWLPEGDDPEILILGAVHGDEAETTVVLSEALRFVPREALRSAVVLCGNPDGLLRGTRGNAAGVDLNRNMPTANWLPDPVCYKSRENDTRDIELSPGTHPGSEPETQALISLIEQIPPRAVVTLHAALACIDDAKASVLGRWIADRTGLPLVSDVGYATPGSFGTWAGERDLTVVTYELEAASSYDLRSRHLPVLIDLMTGNVDF